MLIEPAAASTNATLTDLAVRRLGRRVTQTVSMYAFGLQQSKMAYSQDMRVAAHRHLRSAKILYGQAGRGDQPGCRAVAGYLFGLAAELAIKKLMFDSGMRPLADTDHRDDPFFAHFPRLKTMLGMAVGRRSGELRQLSEDPRLFQNWDTDMRYAPTKEIDPRWVETWKVAAEQLIERMETA